MAVALLVLPLAASLANALRVRNCNLAAGLAFFVLLPVDDGAVRGAARGCSPRACRGARGRVLAFAIPVVSLVWTLLRLYREPAVFAFDPFGGYFPGPDLRRGAAPARGAGLVSGSRASCGWRRRWRSPSPPPGAASIRGAGAAGRWPLALPLAAGVDRVLLGGRQPRVPHRTRRSQARPRPHADDRTLRACTTRAAARRPPIWRWPPRIWSFATTSCATPSAVEPKLPITVWEFPNADAKKQLVGAGGTLYARPWTQEIFMHGTRFPSNRLRHEMAHVFAGTFGDPLFGISLAWRAHGLPAAAQAGQRPGRGHRRGGRRQRSGRRRDHPRGGARDDRGRAGAAAGGGGRRRGSPRWRDAARTRWRDRSRRSCWRRAVRRSCASSTARRATSPTSTACRWPTSSASGATSCRRQPLTTRERARASEDFRRPAIFARVCARELAARLAEARAIQRDEPARAVAILERTCSDDPGEPTTGWRWPRRWRWRARASVR